jgi:STE24 endopeptidase
VLLGLAVLPAPARAGPPGQTYVERRVSAIPAATLLRADPRTLIDQRRQKIAGTLVVYRRVLFLFWAFSQIYALFWFWRSGTAARVRDALKREVRSPVWVRFCFGFAVAAVAGIAAIPASLAEYRVALVFDQSSQSLLQWARDGSLRLTLDALVAASVVAVVFTLVERTRQWWIYSILGLFAAGIVVGWLEPVTVGPLFNRYTPIPQATVLGDRLHVLAVRARVADAPFYVSDASRQTDLPSARVEGYAGTARIVLGDTLLSEVTPGEVAFAAARQLDLYRHEDAARTSFVFAFLFVLSIAIGVLLTDRVRFRGDDDALSRLALVGALSGVAGLVAYPLYNGYSRHIERKADAFAVALTGDRASAVRTFVRAADTRFVPFCTPRAIEIYFSPEPSLGTRIASATGRLNPCR